MGEVRQLLNEWDFIGIGDFGPDDEYDCLLGPLYLDRRARGLP
jgi:hypothetical protein